MYTLEDRLAIRDLQERYATESDRDNQDYYVNIFVKDLKLKVYFNGQLGMDISSVAEMIERYKGFGAAKQSFHMNGQHVIDFVDDEHATGTCYAIATLVTEDPESQQDKLTYHAVRYHDKYVKVDGRWWIAEREQYFVYTCFPPLA